jgi:hypothetical protein
MKLTAMERQTQRALSPQPTLAQSQAMAVDGTTCTQVAAPWNYLCRPQRILAVSMTSTLAVQARRMRASKARLDRGTRSAMYSGRTAIFSLLGAGYHHLEGGLRHVPALAGSAHSQAPPNPSAGEAGNRSYHT